MQVLTERMIQRNMKIFAVEDYEDFTCVGGECPISCCGGAWDIVVDEKTRKYYESVEGDISGIAGINSGIRR